MSSFKGSYDYSVDNKGRINLPAKLRKYVSPDANDTFVITRGYERCLFVYPQDEWARLEQTIRALSSTNPKHRFVLRTFFEKATECQLDGQFRITIPKDLLEHAGIENEVLIIGVLEHIEIWNPKLYREYAASQPESYEDAAQSVFKQQ